MFDTKTIPKCKQGDHGKERQKEVKVALLKRVESQETYLCLFIIIFIILVPPLLEREGFYSVIFMNFFSQSSSISKFNFIASHSVIKVISFFIPPVL
jgi:hypothetical protein